MRVANGIGGRTSAPTDQAPKIKETTNPKTTTADLITEQYLEILRLRAQVSEVERRRNPGQNV